MEIPHPDQVSSSMLPDLLGDREVQLWRNGKRLHTSGWCGKGDGYRVSTSLQQLGRFQLCSECGPSSSRELRSAVIETTTLLAAQQVAAEADEDLDGTAHLWRILNLGKDESPPQVQEKAREALARLEERWAAWTPERLESGHQHVHLLVDEDLRGPAIALAAAATRTRRGPHLLLVVTPGEADHLAEAWAGDAGALQEDDTSAVLETALTIWADEDDLEAADALERARLIHHA